MLKRLFILIRNRCVTFYTVGEHGTAFWYAVCELPERIVHAIMADYMLYGFSIILLVGVLLIGLDKVLKYFGV
jgi:hypothetical protein